MDLIFYTGTNAVFPAEPGEVSLHTKQTTGSPVLIPLTPEAGFSVSSLPPGVFFFETRTESEVIARRGRFEVKQSIMDAPANFDPRSLNEQTLEALEAKIAGRALTIQQSKISVGDRSIEYMNSIDELLKWRDYFRREVAKERGLKPLTSDICVLKRG